MRKTEISEVEALQYANLTELPKPLEDGDPVWIFAIAEVLTYSLAKYYAIVRNSYGEGPQVIRFFGDGGIADILNIYPYKFLDKSFVPTFSGLTEAKSFIAKTYGIDKEKLTPLKKDEVMRLIYNYCMKRQLKTEAEAEDIRNAKQLSDGIIERNKQIRTIE